ncbi:ArsR family transcriptional regulator [Nocardioides sp. Root1257]|uniref:arsenate reductase/protein-tyrosine-phosphatase family protein n=1 Tax=unclassified Nocardioides TaxID=2615069 RepID=UPI0006FE74DC|nr:MULTISPECIES: ArsR family transcriptional regulator [unclassified Nocardioides]KQW48053.1 ArsR family transcriptional regulator [Nocardioides sp. Root1257]KRC46020.1 ArsR family transcriptional regulator [Nocardioides sp. Root224]
MAVVDPVGYPLFIRLVGHPLRWRLLTELARSDLRVRELVDRVDEPQNLVSYHLRVLRNGGLVSATQSSFDGRDSYYHLDLDQCATGLAAAANSLHPSLNVSPEQSPPPSMEKEVARPSVLFVCSGNSARSPLAEAVMRRRAGDRVRVSSAGTRPKDRIHPHAERVLREQYGIDIGGQIPRPLDLGSDGGFDQVVTLCDRAREEVSGSTGRHTLVHWSVTDPTGAADGDKKGSYRRFLAAAADIDSRVRHLLPTLSADTTRSISHE